MATDKSFASQGSAATLSMLKSLPAMVDTSAPHGEGGAFFWLVVPLTPYRLFMTYVKKVLI